MIETRFKASCGKKRSECQNDTAPQLAKKCSLTSLIHKSSPGQYLALQEVSTSMTLVDRDKHILWAKEQGRRGTHIEKNKPITKAQWDQRGCIARSHVSYQLAFDCKKNIANCSCKRIWTVNRTGVFIVTSSTSFIQKTTIRKHNVKLPRVTHWDFWKGKQLGYTKQVKLL